MEDQDSTLYVPPPYRESTVEAAPSITLSMSAYPAESLDEESNIFDYESIDEHLVPPVELVDYDGFLDREQSQDLSYDSFQSLDTTKSEPNHSEENKGRTFFPFIHQQDYLITYEESEQRLIIMGQYLAIFLSLALLPVLASNFQIWRASTSVIFFTPTLEDTNTFNMPLANVLLMGKLASGDMVVLRQMDWNKFEVIWQFKVPRSKVVKEDTLHYKIITLRDLGYSIFENQGDLYIIYNDGHKDTTVIHTKINRDQIVPNSKLSGKLYYFNTLVRVGQLVWMFGGTSNYKYFDEGLSHPHLDAVEHPCSPKYDNENTKTVIWSIKRTRWFDGPSIPYKGCIRNACSVAINKTEVLILIGNRRDAPGNRSGCIHLFLFSFESNSWTSSNDCVINVGQTVDKLDKFVADWTITMSLSCVSQFDKNGKMSIVVMASQHKFYRLEYPKMTSTELQSPIDETTRVDNINCNLKSGASLFTLKNMIYLMVLVEPTKMELYLLDGVSNNFDKIQIVGNFSVENYLSDYGSLMTLPFWQ